MKLAIDCRSLVIPLSGIGRYTQQLVRYLPDVLDPERERLCYVLGAGFGVVRNLDGVHKRIRHGQARSLQTVWEQTMLPWLLVRHGVDVYHSPRNYSIPPVRTTSLVVTIHDVIPLIFPEHAGIRRWSIEARLARAARMADAIITVSQASKRDILRYLRVREERVRVIPLAPAAIFAERADRERISRLRESHGIRSPFVLTSGATKPLKNVRFLAELWPAVRERVGNDVQLVVTGAEWPGYPLPPATKDVRYIGEVSDADLAALMQGAELFAFASLYEGFGLPVVEAMAAGTPVVVSNRGALVETVGDAGIVLPLEDPSVWVEAIANLLKDGQKRREMAEAGRRRAGYLSWQRTVNETVQVYREVYSASARRR